MWLIKLKRFLALLRARYLKITIHPWLLDAWEKTQQAYADKFQSAPLLVVDIETTSLSPQSGEMVSIGWVAIDQGKIQLNSAQHLFLKNVKSVGDSATIHQIRDCQLESGMSLEQAMCAFIQAASGRVLVFHHSPMDLSYLNTYSKQIFSASLLMPVLDTLQIEKKYLDRIGQPIKTGDLTLARTRQRYQLPTSAAHNALSDAIATAELLLAQLAHKDQHINIKQLV